MSRACEVFRTRCGVVHPYRFPWRFGLQSLAVASMLCPVMVAGQVVAEQVLADPATCAQCQLEVERIAVVYDDAGDAGMRPPAPQDMLRTSAGHFIIITTNPNEPLHFSANGEFLGTLGRLGDGPGDYRTPMSVVPGRGDTVWVVDSRLVRKTAWSPEGEFLGSRGLPAQVREAVILEDGSLVLSGAIMTPSSIGLPLHRVTLDGNVLESFGPQIDVEPTGHIPGWIARGLTNAATGGFWAFTRQKYSIKRYTSGGELVTAFERRVEWFPERDPQVPSRLAEDGPSPRLSDLVEDDQGLLRVMISLPDPDWPRGLGERELQPGFEAAGVYWTPVRDHAQVYDFAIEIIDPATAEVLLSRRFDGLNLGWIDEHHFATYHEDDVGVPVIEIYRVDFRDAR